MDEPMLKREMYERAERVFWRRMWACRRTGNIGAIEASSLAVGDVVDDILGIDRADDVTAHEA